MVGSDQVPPERLQRALVEAAVEQFRDRTTTIGLSPSVPASCFARLGEKNQKQEQPRNEAQLHFVSLRSQSHYGARGELSRVEMHAQRLRNLRIGYCWIPAWGAFDGGSRRHTQPTPFFQARFFAACRHAHGVRSPGGGLKSRKQADCRKGALNWSPGRLPPASPG